MRHHAGLIEKAAQEFDVSADLVKATIFTEMSRGWYDSLDPFPRTILPGNVSEYWEKLIPGSDVHNIEDNIRLTAKILKGIEKRLDHPYPEDVYSLYNGMAHDRTYENRKTKNTPFYLKVVLETKAWEYEDWQFHFALPYPHPSTSKRTVVWSGRKASPAPAVPLEAPKARGGALELFMTLPPDGRAPEEEAPRDERGAAEPNFDLLEKTEREAPGGARRASRIAAARLEMTRTRKGDEAFRRVPHYRRIGRTLRFDTTRPYYPRGRSLLTSAQPGRDFYDLHAPDGPDSEFRLPARRTAEQILAEDRRLAARGRGRSGPAVAMAYLINAERDDAQREKERQEEDWAQASLTDPVVGGFDGLDKRILARSALNRIGDPGLYHYLDDSGLRNHPAILRLFYRVGKAFAHRPMPPTMNPPDEGT